MGPNYRKLGFTGLVIPLVTVIAAAANVYGTHSTGALAREGGIPEPFSGSAEFRDAGFFQKITQKTLSRKKNMARRILRVGPKRKLRLPSQAARIARAGDNIKIDAGEYRDCAVWRTDNLILEGVGGYAHVRDKSCKGKGIWVVDGSRTTIIRIEFSGADVRGNNGAGIRFDGGTLVVRDSYFHDNENGILTSSKPQSQVFIFKSRFERNGKCEPVCAHGIYIGKIKVLKVSGSSFAGQKVGHHIKSRARYTEIVGNRIRDGAKGTASFAIDLPNGGTAVIRHNSLQKGPRAQNHMAMIAIGEEGATNPSRGIRIENNVFKNENSKLRQFIWNRSQQPVILKANHFFGKGQHLKGPGRIQP